MKRATKDEEISGTWDQGFEGTRKRQYLSGRQLTPAERLRWLEEHLKFFRSILGKAKPAKKS